MSIHLQNALQKHTFLVYSSGYGILIQCWFASSSCMNASVTTRVKTLLCSHTGNWGMTRAPQNGDWRSSWRMGESPSWVTGFQQARTLTPWQNKYRVQKAEPLTLTITEMPVPCRAVTENATKGTESPKTQTTDHKQPGRSRNSLQGS